MNTPQQPHTAFEMRIHYKFECCMLPAMRLQYIVYFWTDGLSNFKKSWKLSRYATGPNLQVKYVPGGLHYVTFGRYHDSPTICPVSSYVGHPFRVTFNWQTKPKTHMQDRTNLVWESSANSTRWSGAISLWSLLTDLRITNQKWLPLKYNTGI